jgi:hypothetical protein
MLHSRGVGRIRLPPPAWTPSLRDYHSDATRWSSTMLKIFRESPALAWRRYVARDLPADPPIRPMVLGSLVNMILLEPERMDELYLVVGCQDRRVKAFRDAAEAEKAREVVTSAELGEAMEIARAIQGPRTTAARVARKLLLDSEGYPEYSHRWTEKGVPVRCRLDKLAVVAGRAARIELKTSVAPDPDGFGRQAWNLGYHCQAELYLRGATDLLGERPDDYVVAVRNEPPHEVAVYQLSAEFMRYAAWQLDADLEQLAPLLARDPAEPWCAPWESFEATQGAIPYLEPPGWAARSMENLT